MKEAGSNFPPVIDILSKGSDGHSDEVSRLSEAKY